MASRSMKLSNDPSFDSRQLSDTYFSNKFPVIFTEESVMFPMMKLHYTFISGGRVKGNILIDISLGSFIHHLYSPSEIYKEIIILRFNDRCIMELNQWQHNKTGAYDWSNIIEMIKQIKRDSDQEKLKKAITRILKCDINKKNLIDPLVVPPADCVISAWLLESISKDKEEYIKNLRKIIKLLKPGGHLILFGVLNGTYYSIGKERFHLFTYDEKLVQKVLETEGFRVDQFEVLKSKVKNVVTDYKDVLFLVAHKKI